MEHKSESKICQNCKTSFTIEPEDFDFYAKIDVPAPTFCPECRMIRKLVWRNHRSLYRRTCGLCNKNIITMYSDNDPTQVYCYECHISDKWDPKSYGKEIDWNRSFLSQWYELFKEVPRLLQYRGGTLVDSDFTNFSVNNKDVYLSFSVINDENILYSDSVDNSRDSLDCLGGQKIDQCSYNVNAEGNFNCHYVLQTQNSIDCFFVSDCSNCQNCYLSSNLRNQRYVFRNKKVSKEEYQSLISDLKLNTFHGLESAKEEFRAVRERAITRFGSIYASQNATGEFINHSSDVKNSFGVFEGENIKNSFRIIHSKDIYDCGGVLDGELEYETLAGSMQSASIFFSVICLTCTNLEYSVFCKNCSNCFGCVQMRDAQYCILNKQYTKDEYFKTIEKIKKQMSDVPYVDNNGRNYPYGEFFPFEFSPWGYNETVAHDYFPLEKKEAVSKGYIWTERGHRDYVITLKSENIPEDIKEVKDSISNETVECAHGGVCNHQCTNAFKIMPNELIFLRQKKLPLPRLCPNCRHYDRVSWRTSMKLWHRQCMCDLQNHDHPSGQCEVEFETSYSPDRPEKVYCEKCYQREVL